MALSQKLTGFESLLEEEKEGELQYHADCHYNGQGSATYICYLTECTLRPVMMGSIDSLNREISSCTKKELEILESKDFLREFNERDRARILGERDNE